MPYSHGHQAAALQNSDGQQPFREDPHQRNVWIPQHPDGYNGPWGPDDVALQPQHHRPQHHSSSSSSSSSSSRSSSRSRRKKKKKKNGHQVHSRHREQAARPDYAYIVNLVDSYTRYSWQRSIMLNSNLQFDQRSTVYRTTVSAGTLPPIISWRMQAIEGDVDVNYAYNFSKVKELFATMFGL